MSLSSLSGENFPPFFLRPRFAKTRNQSQFVFGMLLLVRSYNFKELLGGTDFFSLIELPNQFSTLAFSLSDMLVQRTGATARAKPGSPIIVSHVQ